MNILAHQAKESVMRSGNLTTMIALSLGTLTSVPAYADRYGTDEPGGDLSSIALVIILIVGLVYHFKQVSALQSEVARADTRLADRAAESRAAMAITHALQQAVQDFHDGNSTEDEFIEACLNASRVGAEGRVDVRDPIYDNHAEALRDVLKLKR
jgi:hypothetical protein